MCWKALEDIIVTYFSSSFIFGGGPASSYLISCWIAINGLKKLLLIAQLALQKSKFNTWILCWAFKLKYNFDQWSKIIHCATKEMVFCYQNCFDQLWKKNSGDWEKLYKFETEGQEFAKFLRYLEQLIQTIKCQNIFW